VLLRRSRSSQCRICRLIVYCQRPKSRRTRKSTLRLKAKRQSQDRELLDYANTLQKELEESIRRLTPHDNSKRHSTRKAQTKSRK